MKRLAFVPLLALPLALALGCEGGVEDPSSLAPERSEGFQVAPAPVAESTSPDRATAPRPGLDSPAPEGTPPTRAEPGSTPPQGPAQDDPGLNCATVYEQVSACYSTYYTCASACAEEACAEGCEADYMSCYGAQVALGSSQAKAAFDALRACEDTHWDPCYEEGGVLYDGCAAECGDEACAEACATEANALLQSCMSESCGQAYAECGVKVDEEAEEESAPSDPESPSAPEGPADSGAGSSVGMSCGELYTCEDSCQGNQSCGQACYDQGTDQAKSQWTQLIQCGMSACNGQVASAEEYKVCLSQMCPQEYGVCFSSAPETGAPGGSSTGTTCGEGYTCIQSCYSTAFDESSFYSCVDGCNGAMSSQAKVLMDSLTSCADAQCYDVPGSLANYYKCIEDFCTSEYMACIDQPASSPEPGPGTGSGVEGEHASCVAIDDAVKALCDTGYSACVEGCADQACADACANEANACVDTQLAQALDPNDAADYEAVLGCWSANYESCYAEGGEVFEGCLATCTDAEEACKQTCNTPAMEAYSQCYSQSCANEYAACGLE